MARRKETYRIAGALERGLDDVDRLLATGRFDLVLDFQDVTFVSVEGLEWLEELLLRSGSSQVLVKFINVPPSVYKVFKVAHVESLLEACGALAASGPAC